MSGTRLSKLLGLAGICTIAAWSVFGTDLVVQGQPPTAAPRQETLGPYMHAKLVHSQQVLRGLVTHNFGDVRKGAGALKQTSLDAPKPRGKDPLDLELYEHFKLEFLRLTTQLGEMADEENLEGAAFVYQNLTANCMACHQFLQANQLRTAN
ncbi:MAG: hypothetical protein KDA90_03695 [Planctomycetaceae bacterium]|nr:hypothetical protein [Planctomycetaceae bacterium]